MNRSKRGFSFIVPWRNQADWNTGHSVPAPWNRIRWNQWKWLQETRSSIFASIAPRAFSSIGVYDQQPDSFSGASSKGCPSTEPVSMRQWNSKNRAHTLQASGDFRLQRHRWYAFASIPSAIVRCSGRSVDKIQNDFREPMMRITVLHMEQDFCILWQYQIYSYGKGHIHLLLCLCIRGIDHQVTVERPSAATLTWRHRKGWIAGVLQTQIPAHPTHNQLRIDPEALQNRCRRAIRQENHRPLTTSTMIDKPSHYSHNKAESVQARTGPYALIKLGLIRTLFPVSFSESPKMEPSAQQIRQSSMCIYTPSPKGHWQLRSL